MIVQQNHPGTAKDAYDSIKKHIVTCEYKPGERFNVEKLAEQFRLSATPIREILYQLSAEKLVSVIPRTGFFMRSFNESEIRDLYETNCLVLSGAACLLGSDVCWALASEDHLLSRARMFFQGVEPLEGYSLTQLTSDFFSVIASMSRNEEIEFLVSNLNDRLYFVRDCEKEVFGDIAVKLKAMCDCLDRSDLDGFCGQLNEYHQTRIAQMPLILRVLKNERERLGCRQFVGR